MTATSTFERCAEIIAEAAARYLSEFATITRRAPARFVARDWRGMHEDTVQRLDLYETEVRTTGAQLRQLLLPCDDPRGARGAIKRLYAPLVRANEASEICLTFFNSVTRRVFPTTEVDPALEFVGADFDRERPPPLSDVTVHVPVRDSLAEGLERALLQLAPGGRFVDLRADARLVADIVINARRDEDLSDRVHELELLRHVFYRGQRAFILARVNGLGGPSPVALALLNREDGLVVDAALLSESDLSMLFGFTRWYFHVDEPCPSALVTYLQELLPQKPRADLYIALGHYKHGKSELYRDVLMQLGQHGARFEVPPGKRGLVMIVFAIPGHSLVFKVIRDKMPPPKVTSRAQVEARYEQVFRHDRGGRLVDAQRFDHLTFARARFAPEVLRELAETAPESVTITDEHVHIQSLYVERRVTPLDVYLSESFPHAARDVLLDYGQAIRDLARTNIFPGDLLLKNFGVTRHGRVVFYDYDELCAVTEANFREFPAPRTDEDELAAEPWFRVGDNDVFPSEFISFLGLTDEQRAIFEEAHGEIFTAAFWCDLQERHRAGELIDIAPYRQACRLRR